MPNFKDPQSIFDLLNFVVFEFVSLSGSVVTRICEGDMGITREEWQFVAMLAKLGGMSPSDLASRTTVDRSQASKTLRTLEVKGLVNRHQVQGDGRRAIIGLTQQGLALYAEFFPKVVHLHNEIPFPRIKSRQGTGKLHVLHQIVRCQSLRLVSVLATSGVKRCSSLNGRL